MAFAYLCTQINLINVMRRVFLLPLMLCILCSLVACSSDGDEPNGGGSGSVYRPKMVDLGLPSGVMWADCNLGAKPPYEAGNYYAYGETETKSDYSWATYKWWADKMTKYTGEDGKAQLEAADDVARVRLGEGYRVPTVADYMELNDKCSWSWVSEYHGANGFLIKGPNGNTIFLPAAGFKSGKYRYFYGDYSCYWLSDVASKDSYTCACGITSVGASLSTGAGLCSRVLGLTVRPVAVK